MASPVTFSTSGKYAGDAMRKLADDSDAVTGTAAIEWTPDHDTLAYARYNRGYKAFALKRRLHRRQSGSGSGIGERLRTRPEEDAVRSPAAVGRGGLLLRLHQRPVAPGLPGGHPRWRDDPHPVRQHPQGGVGRHRADCGLEPDRAPEPQPDLRLRHTEITSGCATFTTPLTTSSNNCFIDPADPLAQAKGAKPAGPANTTTEQGQAEVFQSVKGNALPQAPENKVAFNANYALLFDPGTLTLSGSYVWKDHSYSSIFTRTQYDYAPSWSQVDLRATWAAGAIGTKWWSM